MSTPQTDVQSSDFSENEIWLTDTESPAEFNWHWREVIRGLLDNLPGYQAYARAYEIDISEESGRRVAEANYSRLLRNAKFRDLWRRVLEEIGLNDEMVDSQLYKLITGESVENAVKQRAIAHYNELRGRITRNVKLNANVKSSAFSGLTEEELRKLAADSGDGQS